MPQPILGPGHELPQRLKALEAQAYTPGSLNPVMEAPSGMYVSGAWMNVPSGVAAGSTGSGVNVIEFYPFYVPLPVTVTSISINVTTAQTGWNGIHAGFYAGSLTGYTLVQDFGIFDVSTTGQKTLTGSWDIPKGWMWVASRLEGGGTIVPSVSRVDNYVPLVPLLGATYNTVGMDTYGLVTSAVAPDGSNLTLPATITPADALSNSPMQFAVQVK